MKTGKCPHCGSDEVYLSDDPLQGLFAIKTDMGDLFSVRGYLCLSCRAVQFEVLTESAVLFGKPKQLQTEVPLSTNWQKINKA